jgi:hypothetical protein
MAFGAMIALRRKAEEGGSWHVRVSLAQTGHWLTSLGRLKSGFACPEPSGEELRALTEEMATPFGRVSFVKHAAQLSDTPAFWARPPAKLGAHAPVWPV